MPPSSQMGPLGAAALSFALFVIPAAAASARDLDGAARAPATARFLAPSELGADLQQALFKALGAGFRIRGDRVLAAQAGLEPVWRTMAKDAHGRVDSRSLRYIVQRHFRHKYHISVIGMEDLQVNSTSSASEAKLFAELTPNFVRSLLEGASAEAGFSLKDIAALIAAVEYLIQDAGHEQLVDSYRAKGVSVAALLTRDQLLDVMTHYMLRWLFSQDLEGVAKNEENRTLFKDLLSFELKPFIDLAEGHLLAFEHKHLHDVASSRADGSWLKESWNPFRPLFSFADALTVISAISTQFGTYWETECESLMEALLRGDRRGTGRVTLANFHSRALDGEWHFTESETYLRHLGVLDETSSSRGPQVIAANYLQSSNNCVVAQNHFRVCCANPCQDFYLDLEEAIRAPVGAPEDVLAIVSNFTYGLEDAAPRITKKLTAQLDEIAQANNGKIPLHSRLFAQWLHFVFPSECPFPHKSNSVSGLSPTEFGLDVYMATVEEMRENARREEDEARANGTSSANSSTEEQPEEEGDECMAMWSPEEELLSPRLRPDPAEAGGRLPGPPLLTRGTLRAACSAAATLAVFLFGVLRPALGAARALKEGAGWAGNKEQTAGDGKIQPLVV